MQPADQILVQKQLGATLARVAEMQKNLLVARASLKQQEQALYDMTKDAETQPEETAPVGIPVTGGSPSILDGDVDMSSLNQAIEKLAKGCNCPNLDNPSFLLNSNKEGT